MDKSKMHKVVYDKEKGCLRLKDKNGDFIPQETSLIIDSSVGQPEDTALVTVTMFASIEELKK